MAQNNVTNDHPVVFEAETQVRFLPRCPICLKKHPLAYNPPLPPDVCPTCGAQRAAPDDAVVVPSAATDGRVRLGMALSRIGAALNRFSRRL